MKYFLFFLLFMLSLTTFAKPELYNLLKDPTCDLAYNVQLPDTSSFHDFTNVKAVAKPIYRSVPLDPMFPEEISLWYYTDFSEDPFDGRLEIMTMGEPSASVISTLLISCILGAMLYVRKRNASLAQ